MFSNISCIHWVWVRRRYSVKKSKYRTFFGIRTRNETQKSIATSITILVCLVLYFLRTYQQCPIRQDHDVRTNIRTHTHACAQKGKIYQGYSYTREGIENITVKNPFSHILSCNRAGFFAH